MVITAGQPTSSSYNLAAAEGSIGENLREAPKLPSDLNKTPGIRSGVVQARPQMSLSVVIAVPLRSIGWKWVIRRERKTFSSAEKLSISYHLRSSILKPYSVTPWSVQCRQRRCGHGWTRLSSRRRRPEPAHMRMIGKGGWRHCTTSSRSARERRLHQSRTSRARVGSEWAGRRATAPRRSLDEILDHEPRIQWGATPCARRPAKDAG